MARCVSRTNVETCKIFLIRIYLRTVASSPINREKERNKRATSIRISSEKQNSREIKTKLSFVSLFIGRIHSPFDDQLQFNPKLVMVVVLSLKGGGGCAE